MMLQIENLHTHYGLSHVIQGVDLSAGAGEVIGIFGRNGVGKTTLLKTIAGWVTPTEGRIAIRNRETASLSPDAIAREGVGFVPEDRRIFPGLTVEENLSLGQTNVPRSARKDGLGRMLDRFPRLAERRRQIATTLSGGEQQMLAMARAMIAEPRLVLIDEPSEGLAPMIVAEIFAIIRELRETGATVLLVEQNVHEALAVADRFIAIERGQIALTGGRSEADRNALIAKLEV